MCEDKFFECIVGGVKTIISGHNLVEAKKNCLRKFKSHGYHFHEVKKIYYVRNYTHIYSVIY